jgi:hypothetical protein
MSNIILIHTALKEEAECIIQALSLKLQSNTSKFKVYSNENIYLTISGIGKINCATCLGAILNELSYKHSITALNIGIAGSSNLAIGTFCNIVKCIDVESLKVYYTDQTLALKGLPSTIETHSKPIICREELTGLNNLVDMELSAFFQSAKYFCSASELYSFKIVSDNLSADFNKDLIKEIFNANLNLLIENINIIKNNIEQADNILTSEETEKIIQVTKNLKFTKSQEFKILDLARYYKLKNNKLPHEFEDFLNVTITQKHQAKLIFDNIRGLFV